MSATPEYQEIGRLTTRYWLYPDTSGRDAIDRMAGVTRLAAALLAGCRNGQRVRLEVAVETPEGTS
jgi:hypothetical protein